MPSVDLYHSFNNRPAFADIHAWVCSKSSSMYLSGIQHHTLRLCFGQKYHLFTHGWPFDGEFEDPVEVIAGQTFFPRLNTSVSFKSWLGSSCSSGA